MQATLRDLSPVRFPSLTVRKTSTQAPKPGPCKSAMTASGKLPVQTTCRRRQQNPSRNNRPQSTAGGKPFCNSLPPAEEDGDYRRLN